MTTAGEAIQYLRWRKDVADHDYAAASSYLSIRFGESRAQEVSKKLQKLPVIQRRANDILRATQRVRARPLRGRAAQARLRTAIVTW